MIPPRLLLCRRQRITLTSSSIASIRYCLYGTMTGITAKQSDLVDTYARRPTTAMNIKQMLYFGRTLDEIIDDDLGDVDGDSDIIIERDEHLCLKQHSDSQERTDTDDLNEGIEYTCVTCNRGTTYVARKYNECSDILDHDSHGDINDGNSSSGLYECLNDADTDTRISAWNRVKCTLENNMKGHRDFIMNSSGSQCFDTLNSVDSLMRCNEPLEQVPHVTCHVTSAELRNNDTYCVYKLEIHIGEQHWTSYRRFKHFYDLHRVLQRMFPQVFAAALNAPVLPLRRYFKRNKFDPKFIESRRQGLDDYIMKLLHQKCLFCCSLVRDFLTSRIPSCDIMDKVNPDLSCSDVTDNKQDSSDEDERDDVTGGVLASIGSFFKSAFDAIADGGGQRIITFTGERPSWLRQSRKPPLTSVILERRIVELREEWDFESPYVAYGTRPLPGNWFKKDTWKRGLPSYWSVVYPTRQEVNEKVLFLKDYSKRRFSSKDLMNNNSSSSEVHGQHKLRLTSSFNGDISDVDDHTNVTMTWFTNRRPRHIVYMI